MLITSISTSGADEITTLKIQPDGKILAAGSVGTPLGGAYTIHAVARYLGTGALDASFNTAGPVPGVITGSFNGTNNTNDDVYALAIQSDGKIIVAGRTWEAAKFSYALARYWNDVTTTGKVYGVEGSQYGVTSTWNSSLSVTAPHLRTVQTQTSTALSLMGISVDAAANRLYTRDSGTAGHKVYVIDTINNMTIAEIIVSAASSSAGGGVAVYSGTNRAYANNNNAGAGTTVVVIDTSDNTVIATIPGFNGPRGMALDATSNRLYVANGGAFNGTTVSVVDTVTNTIVSTLTGFNVPSSPVFDDISGKLFVLNEGAGTVTAITTATGARDTMTVGAGPFRAALDSAAQRLYVANYNAGSGNTVSVINTATNQTIDTITTPTGPRTVRIDTSAKKLYVDCDSDQTIHVYDVTGYGMPQVGTLGGGWANMVIVP